MVRYHPKLRWYHPMWPRLRVHSNVNPKNLARHADFGNVGHMRHEDSSEAKLLSYQNPCNSATRKKPTSSLSGHGGEARSSNFQSYFSSVQHHVTSSMIVKTVTITKTPSRTMAMASSLQEHTAVNGTATRRHVGATHNAHKNIRNVTQAQAYQTYLC